MNKLFSFGVVADAQYADIPDSNEYSDRRFRQSLPKLEEAIRFFNAQELEFVVHLGDAIDQNIDSFAAVMSIFESSRAEVLQVLGNHDFSSGEGHARKNDYTAVLGRLGLNEPYYSREFAGWKFIVIDANEVGVIEHSKGTREYEAGEGLIRQLQSEGRLNAQTWNGALSDRQLSWVLDELEAARLAGQKAIIFSHHPIFPKHRENLLNDEEVLPQIAQFENLVAFINGHNHDGNYGKYKHLHCLTIHGMVDTEENSYALAHVFDDRIEIEGYGRQPNRTLLFDK